MSTQSSLVVQRGIATMRAVEQAIARQVLHGGDLATNLLEVAFVDEGALIDVLAQVHGMEAGPSGRLPSPPASPNLLPGELALRYGIFPLRREGRALIVATSEPLSAVVEEDLAFAMDVTIRQRIVPLVRIRQAIADRYGMPLDRRFARLVARLEGRPDPSPSTMPPPGASFGPMHLPRPASVPPATIGAGVAQSSQAISPDDADARFAPSPPAGASAIPRPPATLSGPDPVLHRPPGGPIRRLTSTGLGVPPPPPLGPPSAPRRDRGKVLAGWIRRTLYEGKGDEKVDAQAGPQAPPRRVIGRDAGSAPPMRGRRKGPYTPAMVEEDLAQATDKDAVLDVVFTQAQQYFLYTALFIVQGDLAEGCAAKGPGADTAKLRGLGVPMDLPSVLCGARERRCPVVGLLAEDGLDVELRRDLDRPDRLGAVAVIPVVVRSRTVALVWGDDGAESVDLADLGDVIAGAGLAATALERIALERKRGRRASVPTPHPERRGAPSSRAPSARVGGSAEALVRALGLHDAQRPSSRSPPPASGTPEPAPERGAPVPDEPLGVSPAAQSVRPPAGLEPAAGWREPVAEGELLGGNVDDVVPAPPLLPGHAMETSRRRMEREGRITEADAALPPEGFDAPERRADRRDRPTARAVRALAGASPDALAPPAPIASTPRDSRHTSPGLGAPSRPEPRLVLAPSSAPPAGPRADERRSLDGNVYPLPPPPVTIAAVRPLSRRPIPREEVDSEVEPTHGTAPVEIGWLGPEPGAPKRRTLPIGAGAADDAHPAPRSTPTHETSPSLVVDVAVELDLLLARVAAGGPDSDEAFAEAVRHGEHILAALGARFPGPLRVDRHRARDLLPAASQCGPILELCVALGRAALPLASARATSTDVEMRFWATHVLGDLRYPEAANAVLARLFDDEPAVRRIARRAAAALVAAGSAGAPIVVGLDRLTQRTDEPLERREVAIETMGEIRSGLFVPTLVTALADPFDELAEAARRSLLLTTRQDFGRNTLRWSEWWSAHRAHHRVEWLIDALMHELPSVRRAAGDELKLLTKEYFGYYDDLPKRERERAQARYRDWWESEGRARFDAR